MGIQYTNTQSSHGEDRKRGVMKKYITLLIGLSFLTMVGCTSLSADVSAAPTPLLPLECRPHRMKSMKERNPIKMGILPAALPVALRPPSPRPSLPQHLPLNPPLLRKNLFGNGLSANQTGMQSTPLWFRMDKVLACVI